MKTQIDIKSVLLGILVGVLAVFAIGAGTSPTTPDEAGRYRVSTGTTFAIVLDTKTGKAWSYALPNNGGRNDANFFDAKPN